MSTTFFEQQQAARVRTRWTLFGFALSVLLTVFSVKAITGWALWVYHSDGTGRQAGLADLLPAMLVTGGFTLFVILLASAVRHVQMRAGPERVLTALGGWKVPPDTQDLEQRRLLNIVEEMAVASGVPVPDVYILDEPGINACAAGLQIDRAAVGVTRGALVAFNREEMQGVIAHEFSHILNGDMRLNTRLIAWLAGLFGVCEIGSGLMHAGMLLASPRRRSVFSSKRDDGGGFGVVLIALGATVWVCGSIGYFFGKILQAATSRQREFLADASAVQFTRNPGGVANALRKLGPRELRANIEHSEGAECAHMMFGNAGTISLAGLTATHPPLPKRIRRIDPAWDGSYLEPRSNWVDEKSLRPTPPPVPKRTGPPPLPQGVALTGNKVFLALLDNMGMPSSEAVDQTRAWLEALPGKVRDHAHTPAGAQALVYRLLLHDDAEVLKLQRKELSEREERPVLEVLEDILRDMPEVEEGDRLPLLDLCVPALRGMEPGRKNHFTERIQALIRADGKVSLFEYALRRVVLSSLESETEARAHTGKPIHISNAGREVNTLLSALAWLGADNAEQAGASFTAARERLVGFHGGVELELLPAKDCGLDALHRACETLSRLTPPFQQRVILASLAAVAVDGVIRPAELHAFRAAAAALRVPVPATLRVSET